MDIDLYNTDSNFCYKTPPELKTYKEKNAFFEKRYMVTKQNCYTSEILNGKHVFIEDTVEKGKIHYHPRKLLIFALLLLVSTFVLLTIYTINNMSNITSVENNSGETNFSTKEININSEENLNDITLPQSNTELLTFISQSNLVTNGMVFPNSSSEEVDHNLLFSLKENCPPRMFSLLIRMGVNEIYAKNHYSFKSSIWMTYYSSFDWYSPDPYANVSFDSFNAIELKNLNLFLEIENQLQDN